MTTIRAVLLAALHRWREAACGEDEDSLVVAHRLGQEFGAVALLVGVRDSRLSSGRPQSTSRLWIVSFIFERTCLTVLCASIHIERFFCTLRRIDPSE